MIEIYTIGFTKKSAKKFFSLLEDNKVKLLIDIRLNNTSQLSGFAKGPDLSFFLNKINKCGYVHDTALAPSNDILEAYKSKKIDWKKYEIDFIKLMETRNIENHLVQYSGDVKAGGVCLLCSEDLPNQCHRRIVADVFAKKFSVSVHHLI